MRRRRFLALAALALAVGAGPAPVSAQAAPPAAGPLTLVEPYGPHSSTGFVAELLRAPLARALGRPVEVVSVPGDSGGAAFDRVAAAAPDGATLLLAQILAPAAFTPHGTPPRTLRDLPVVAKLTTGLSAALFVAPDSPIRSWTDFAAAARERPLRLGWNPNLIFALPVAMMEASLDRAFTDVQAHDRAAMIAAVLEGRADAALLPTASLLTDWPKLPVRPILTFGGERNPTLADVPTFREQTDRKPNATTGAIAVFAPPGTPPATVAALAAALAEAAATPEARAAAEAGHYPLAVSGADTVGEAMDRDRRQFEALGGLLRTPR